MMYRLWRYDVFRFAQNDVARFTRNDAMFALMCPQAHIIRRSRHHWHNQHHLLRQTSFKKRTFVLVDKSLFLIAKEQYCTIKSVVCQMMYRLWRYDVFRFAQNDVARFTRNDAMFALMCPQAHIIRRSRHHWHSQHHLPKANIIQKKHLCLGRQKCVFCWRRERDSNSRYGITAHTISSRAP